MELPQPRPFGTEGMKTTHDFLSLYSSAQQDPRPQGDFLKTHDFLQPLEQVGKNVAKEEDEVVIKDVEKPPPAAPSPAVEHILPGGIGTYSITYFNQKIPKPEGNLFMMAQASSTNRNDENSNCSSYTGSGFTLWDESAVKKGKTGKENNVVDKPALREAVVNMGGGPWTTSSERPSQSSSNQKNNNTTISSLSSSQPSSAARNNSFMNMITSAKSVQEEDDDDEEEEFVVKKEPSSHPKGNLSVKADGISNDQKPNTPRSKHSATEQRRRCKINDRFQKLREIIPHGDQKRDKASFLLEVIEYIQFLQERVQKFEDPYPGWNQEPSKLMPWRNPRTPDDFINQTQPTNIGSGPALMLAAKFDESKASASPVLPINGQHLVEADISSATAFREKVRQIEITNKAASVPLPLRPSMFPFAGATNTPTTSRPACDVEKPASQPQSPFWPAGSFITDSATSDKLKGRELAIESGTISISSIYSQGLLNTLTQALQTSGVDISQASISVQIDLGKRANGRVNSSASIVKEVDNPTNNQAMPRSVVTSIGEDSGQALKRLKTSRCQ